MNVWGETQYMNDFAPFFCYLCDIQLQFFKKIPGKPEGPCLELDSSGLLTQVPATSLKQRLPNLAAHGSFLERLKTPIPRLHGLPIKSECLGVGVRHQYLLKIPVSRQGAAAFGNHCLSSPLSGCLSWTNCIPRLPGPYFVQFLFLYNLTCSIN